MKRLNYFDEQFLRAKDFIAEQAYHLGMRRRVTSLLHTPGIVEGSLEVTRKNDTTVTIGAGAAIDAAGNEIVLEAPQDFDLATVSPAVLTPGRQVVVSIAYDEVTDEKDDRKKPTRITEGVKLKAAEDAGKDDIVLAVFTVSPDRKIPTPLPATAVRKYASARLAAGSVSGKALAPRSVTDAALAPLSVTKDALAPGAVTKDALGPGAVTKDALGPGAVQNAALAPESVSEDNLQPEVRKKLGGGSDGATAQAVKALADSQTRLTRYLHTPGILTGLEVVKTGDLEVLVRTGAAIDPSGREIMVEKEVTLSCASSRSPERFSCWIVVSFEAPTPVLVRITPPTDPNVILLGRLDVVGTVGGSFRDEVFYKPDKIVALDDGVRVFAGARISRTAAAPAAAVNARWQVKQLFEETQFPRDKGLSAGFTTSGGTLMVFMSGTCELIGMQNQQIGVSVVIADKSHAVSTHGRPSDQKSALCASGLVVSGLPAGTHTLSVKKLNDATLIDVRDRFSVTILELPF